MDNTEQYESIYNEQSRKKLAVLDKKIALFKWVLLVVAIGMLIFSLL